MPKVAVVTDSSSCLPGELIERYGIITVPLSFLFDGQLYYDGALTSHDFYDRLRASRHLPTTTSPAPGRFLEAFRQAQQAGASAALCLTLSASYSGTYSSARTAVDLATQELPGFPVRALDTRGLAMAHGFAVLAAARAAEAGADLDEVAATAEAVRDRTHLVGAMDTMRYLAKGGRVPWIAHWASALLQIKPILAANADKVTGVGRVRTLGAAMERLVRYLAQRTQPGAPLHVAVMHADAPERAQELARRVHQRFSPAELIVTEFTSVMGIHIGPGFVGLAFYSETNGEAQRAVGAAGSTPARPPEDDVRTLEASLNPIPPPRSTATLLVLTGLPGSGKSHLARQLCQRHPMARLDSDALRQALFPHPSHSAEESARLFTACHALLDRLLARRIPAVLDATNLREVHRRPLFDLAKEHGASLFLVEVKAPPELISQRLQARKRGDNPWDKSEADIAVYERMKGEAEPIAEPHIVIDTAVDTGPALDKLVRELQAGPA
ncbi:MAG: DegV family protein [Dehalococcoidia bacterium]